MLRARVPDVIGGVLTGGDAGSILTASALHALRALLLLTSPLYLATQWNVPACVVV